jgi:radical SAM superfamily enzyme YgiQ (UPF0313 family)
MKILFIQLPLPDHGHAYIQGNVEYAPAAMAAYLRLRTKLPVSFEFLPFYLANFASNRIITRYITALRPDAVAFTTYLWNLERGLRIAAEIKKAHPDITVIFGGPEISPGSYAFADTRPQVDFFVHGEGEWFFSKYLEGDDIGRHATVIRGNMLITQPQDELIPADDITEPFTNNYLNTMADGSIFLELTRGCPYRCSYCYYSKNCAAVREAPVDVLLRALDRKNMGLSEIYILSPTFNRTRSFRKNLERIAARNPGISLHTEMRANGIDGPLARAIYDAGFRSLEIGLQTLTPAALKSVGRRADVRKELQGMRHLRDAGIDLKIGVIPGLPGDTPEGFTRTVETLVGMGFSDSIELYRLMLLPGTRIREMADLAPALYQDRPPYYLIQGWDFTRGSLAAVIDETTRATGSLQHSSLLPDFTRSSSGLLVQGVLIDGRAPSSWDASRYGGIIETAVFSFHVIMHGSLPDPRLLQQLVSGLPHDDQLYHIILHTDHLLDQEMVRGIQDLLPEDSLHRRMHLYSGADPSTVRFHQVMSDITNYATAMDSYSAVTPVFRIGTANYRHLLDSGLTPGHILVADDIYPTMKKFLVDIYGDAVECVAFEREADMADFYTVTGTGVFRMPEFSTRTLY